MTETNEIISRLIALSRHARPESWAKTLEPIASRVHLVLDAHEDLQRHIDMTEGLLLIEHGRLIPRLVPDASNLLFYALSAGAELASLIGQNFHELRAGLRQAYRASKEPDFVDAVQNLRRDLQRAESSIERAQALVAQVTTTLLRLSEMEIESQSYVVPEKHVTFTGSPSTTSAKEAH